MAAAQRILVVLDDDPTGTQSVHDLPVLTRWEVADLRWAFDQAPAAVYVLTNSRSLEPADAARRNEEVARAALEAAAQRGVDIGFVSRSDSTLRGHFPLETDVLDRVQREVTGAGADAVVLVPAFPEAGRVTIDGTHHLRAADGTLTPAGESEFARDASFGYTASHLPGWVEEKSAGRIRAADVRVLDLALLRGGPEGVAAALREPGTAPRCVVADAEHEDDLRALAAGLELAEAQGLRVIHRVGPPFVRARIGQEPRSPLTADEVYAGQDPAERTPGGLIVVGSHVGLTTRQLERLHAGHGAARTVELDVPTLLEEDSRAQHLRDRVAEIVAALAHGDVVVHTSRTLVRTEDADGSLRIARAVSSAVVETVQRVLAAAPPRFVIAKGGITSSDVAAHGLEIRRAVVRGPMLPGIVSLWQAVDGPARGIPYVVFAGNVGDDDSLLQVTRTLSATASEGASA
ncbi:four-carbon acid sugar kinase family protein [Brachybacterium phenoliresistens]|uniref:Hrp-dependent type III effector protein n=1 Tax=Brachybacterium phenoliresistens TaxID=396014 RepID=Z9JQI8_9MICO|nr:four-carbon acid sugar kinase family protein [Brachybacterium phenoliresistens]EWS80454.1 hypothetical protein BF93_03535 [Brachybacterium phenoliresistens]